MLTIKFVDGELVQNVGWNSLPDKPIIAISVEIQGRKIKMRGFEEYNHLQEKAFNVIGGTTQLRAIYLMGRKNNKIKVIRLNLIDETIKECETEIGQEYNGRPSTGWKIGVLHENPQYKII
jgi:hypothetical protein